MDLTPPPFVPERLTPDPTHYRQAFRRNAGAVWIVTAEHRARRSGFTASSVISLAPEPPELLVSVQGQNSTFPLLAGAGRFGVSLLGHEQHALAERFTGRGRHAGAERFAEGAWRCGPDGVWLLDDALAAFSCELVETLTRGAYSLIIGRITAVQLGAPRPALIYADGAYVDRHGG